MRTTAGELGKFTEAYRSLFKDQRLYRGFQATLWGILGSGSCRVSRIASSNPLTGTTPHAERRIRRLVHGDNKRADLGGEALSRRFSEQGALRLRGEREVLLLLDESDLRKPHSGKLEHLDTVRDLAGGPVAGFHTLNVLGIGASGRRALLYHKSFSTRAPGFTSVNDEHLQAIDQVGRALRAQGAGRLLWVLDRGFDDLKLMRHLHDSGQCFVLRVQHPERKVLGPRGKPQRLDACLASAPTLGRLELARVWFDPQTRRRASLLVTLRACPLRPVDAPGLPLVALRPEHPELASPWLLLTNLGWSADPSQQLVQARHLLQCYRQRWAVEDLFAWTKAALDWQSVRLLDYQALRTLVAFSWLAAAFLFDLGYGLDHEEAVLLARLGGWRGGPRKPGKQTFAQGLKHLCSYLILERHMQDPQEKQAILALRDKLFHSP